MPSPALSSLTRTLRVAALVLAATAAQAADDEDALSLQADAPASPAPASATAAPDGRARWYAEAALGQLSRRAGLPTVTAQRLSLDYSQTFRFGGGWRGVLSNRFDDLHPVGAGERSGTNSLREAYVSWQGAEGGSLAEFGRINVRLGPAYGFNPTDFFREGALRSVTTVDPLALRENRQGTVMLRAQHLWSSGALMVALAPKLANQPSDATWSADLGATNRRDRALITVSEKLGERINWQLLAYGEQGRGPQLGANATALLSDAAVAHVEWSSGREADRLTASLGQPAYRSRQQRLAGGLTYTAASRLAITVELAYNQAAPDQARWQAAGAIGPQVLGNYLLDVQQRQDSAARQSWLVYATQKSLGLKNLDMTGFIRASAVDHSHFAWLELRYHWAQLDTSLQWFVASGKPLSEYGVIPNRQSIQLLGTWYF